MARNDGAVLRRRGRWDFAQIQIVFRDDDEMARGRQRIVSVDGRRVSNRLKNRGPLGTIITPRVDFVATPIDDDRPHNACDRRLASREGSKP